MTQPARMILFLFAVFDSAAKRFLDPFPAPTLEVALREFRMLVNRDGSQFNAYPEDYTLFVFGEFDQESGAIDVYEAPRSLGVAITMMQPKGMPDGA